MSFEKYLPFYNNEIGTTLRKNQSHVFDIDGKELDLTKEHKLFVTGDTNLFYQFKTEPDYIKKYHAIDDALDTDNAYKAQYCLNMSCKAPDGLVKRIYKHVDWPIKLSFIPMTPVTDDFDFGIFVKAENLKFEKDGYCRIALDIKYKNDGSVQFYDTTPDERIELNFEQGSYDWKYIGKKVNIDHTKCDFCGYWIECFNYSGKLYIETPVLSGNGNNTLPEFTTPTSSRACFDWTAQNISKKEWPSFRIFVNGKEIFCGEVFERSHIGSEWSVVIPKNILTEGINKFEIHHISDYHDVIPYTIRELSIIERSAEDFEIVAVAPSVAVSKTLPVLIKTRKDNITARFCCPSGKLSGKHEYTFANKGLHGVQLKVEETGHDVEFFFEYENKKIHSMCPFLCIKEDDGVIVGSGDMIYVHQDKESFEEFLCWYMSNNIGNLLTMRPTYRWSGTRIFDEKLWRDFAKVLNELGIKYSLMVDGRELPGMDCNAPDDVIGGNGYLGRQMHERDGAAYYWSPARFTDRDELHFIDMGERIFREKPEYSHYERAPQCFIYENGNVYHYRSHNVPRDYKEGHDYSVKRLSDMRFAATRHTGPTVMFKSFIEAGYDTIGAETMYSSTEPLCAFMRGIYNCTNKPFTVHHALQWYAKPHDSKGHVDRHRLANYVSYMQGAGEINTEEGFWRIEQAFSKFHRFTPCLKNLIKANEDFYKYISSHTRKGKFYSPVAFISGKYDGWINFGNGRMWGLYNEINSEPECSWDKCLKPFYPEGKISDFLSGKYLDNVNHSVGFFTGTPLGNIDVVPYDADEKILKQYRLICFAGYNFATAEDFDKLYSLCENGSHVILSRSHFATETDMEKVRNHELKLLNHKLSLTDGNCKFEEKTYKGNSLSVCTNYLEGYEAIACCDDGTPLLMQYKMGKGCVTILNTNLYPSHDIVSDVYTNYITTLTETINKQEKVYVQCGNDVQFTVYDNKGERHIYLLAVDWYNESEILRNAVIYDRKYKYSISVPFGTMIKAVCKDNTIIYPTSENGEVLEINGDSAILQGSGKVTFIICKNGKQKEIVLSFDKETVQQIQI